MIYIYKQHKNLKKIIAVRKARKIPNQIKDKLQENIAIIRADKGNIIVSEIKEFQEKTGGFYK